ncbi:Uncharacterised protein [uncultured archaeon]|nr:Uncharacterised protein [uncultured archaeon]
MKNYFLLGMALVLLLTFSLAAEVDCGLRGYDGNTIIHFACDIATGSSSLKINKTGVTYGIPLVSTTNTNASKFRIKTSTGIMALKKYAPCGNGTCEAGIGENCSTCTSDCGSCAYCGDGVCNNGETCLTCGGDCGCTGGRVCSLGTCAFIPQWTCYYSGTFSSTQWWQCSGAGTSRPYGSCPYSYNASQGYVFYPYNQVVCEYGGMYPEMVCGIDYWTMQWTCTYTYVTNYNQYQCYCA